MTWNTVLDYAREYATKKGPHKAKRWLKHEFNRYFDWHEKEVLSGRMVSFGGQTGSNFNRSVMVGRIYLDIRPDLNEQEAKRLFDTLCQFV